MSLSPVCQPCCTPLTNSSHCTMSGIHVVGRCSCRLWLCPLPAPGPLSLDAVSAPLGACPMSPWFPSGPVSRETMAGVPLGHLDRWKKLEAVLPNFWSRPESASQSLKCWTSNCTTSLVHGCKTGILFLSSPGASLLVAAKNATTTAVIFRMLHFSLH